MASVVEIIEQISKLGIAEQEEVAHALLEQLPPLATGTAGAVAGIVSTPGVCGGAARIIGTRIPIWALVRMRQLGISEADILRSYPTLRAIDLVHAWTYVENRRDEVERQIHENEEAARKPCLGEGAGLAH